jgi:hypothetical protein
VVTDDAQEWRAAREESVAALTEALSWHLPEPWWKQVEETLADMAAAASPTATSPQALWQATGLLELYSPLRVTTRLGDTPQLPAPKAVRERIAELIDTLSAERGQMVGDVGKGSGFGTEKPASV